MSRQLMTKGTKRNTLMMYFFFCMCWRQTVLSFESFWWEIWMRHNVEHQFSPLVIGPLATWKESKHAQNLKPTKKSISMHGYCKQRPVNSTGTGMFFYTLYTKDFCTCFLFQDFEPNGLPPKKWCSNRRALGIEGWGTKFSGGKLRTWWFWTDSTMAQHYSTTIWGNSAFFSQAFLSKSKTRWKWHEVWNQTTQLFHLHWY